MSSDPLVVGLLAVVGCLLLLVIWERVSRVRECRELRRENLELLQRVSDGRDDLLDRLFEKDIVERVAKGTPVPERVLRGPEPTAPANGNGIAEPAVEEAIVLDDEAEAMVEQLRKRGWTDDRIGQELRRMQRAR